MAASENRMMWKTFGLEVKEEWRKVHEKLQKNNHTILELKIVIQPQNERICTAAENKVMYALLRCSFEQSS
jgi:hypothetical protein